MPYKFKADRNRRDRERRKERRAEREAKALIPGTEEFEKRVEKEREEEDRIREKRDKILYKEFDPEDLDRISSKEYQKGVDEAFKTVEDFEEDPEPEPVKPRPSNVAKIRGDLTPSEIEWLKRHPDVSEHGVSGLLYDREGKGARSYILDKHGNLKKEKKKEDENKSPWKF